jgi:hypothetical protein
MITRVEGYYVVEGAYHPWSVGVAQFQDSILDYSKISSFYQTLLSYDPAFSRSVPWMPFTTKIGQMYRLYRILQGYMRWKDAGVGVIKYETLTVGHKIQRLYAHLYCRVRRYEPEPS